MSTRLLTTRTARRTSRQRQTRQSQTRQRQTRRAGFTVIEVLVAMFILLVGGLAILNIFPPALQVIRGSENREIAISMTQSVLERYSNQPDTIPDAIYSDNGNGVWTDAGNVAVAGTRIRNNSLPNAPANFANSALDRFKRIVGERHRVLEDRTVLAGGVGTPFVLSNFSQTGTPLFYVEEEIVGVKVSGPPQTGTDPLNGTLDFRNARLQSDETVSLADAQISAQIADGVGAGERDWDNVDSSGNPLNLRYYVSYRYLEGTNVAGVEDERVDIPANNRVFQSRALTPRAIVAGEISMRVRIPIIAPLTLTPAESSIGYLRLRDGAGNIQDALGRFVNVNDIVSVDYTVADWRTLVFDFDTSTSTSKNLPPVALTDFRDIKLPVSALNNQPFYAMLFNKTTTGLTPQSGAIGQWRTLPLLPVPPVRDVSNLSATLGVAAGTNPQARISYQTSRGWAQQVSVAAKNYYPFVLNRPIGEREQWREYSWTAGAATGQNIYFRASEAGKTILVTFKINASIVTNQVVPVARDLVDAGLPTAKVPISVNGFVPNATTKISQAVLLDRNGVAIPATAILSVRGASIRSRTAWIENNNYVQEVKEDYRPLTD